jgi:DNA-binding NarL/FixJ family response regulator
MKYLFLSAVVKRVWRNSSIQRWIITMIRIVIIDGKDSERHDTEKVLSAQRDFKVVATGKDGFEAIRLAAAHKPDVALLDINLSYVDGVKAAAILNSRYPHMAMVILTCLDDVQHIRNAINSGVSGYFLKNKDMEKLAEAIRVIHDNGCLIFPRSAMGLDGVEPHSKTDRQFPVNLSRIDLQIIRYIGGGLENQEIAEKMRLKIGTIRNRISVILRKTALKNKTQLAIFAIQNGFGEEAPVV